MTPPSSARTPLHAREASSLPEVRPQSANARESDGSLTHVSPGFVVGNPIGRGSHLPGVPRARHSSRRTTDPTGRCETIQDTAGGLEKYIAEGSANWQLTKRECQRRDLGHPCRGCGAPLTEVGQMVYVWKAPTFIKRFHLDCATSFDGNDRRPSTGYADAWRRSQLSEKSVRKAAERQASKEAARRWPVYPTAGMLWRAGTLALMQERKDKDGVEAWKRQMAALHKFTQDSGGLALLICEDDPIECGICLGELISGEHGSADNSRRQVLALPCDRSHAYHAQCLEPWLRRNFQCPKCRADLRPLLDTQVAQAVAQSIRNYHNGGMRRLVR